MYVSVSVMCGDRVLCVCRRITTPLNLSKKQEEKQEAEQEKYAGEGTAEEDTSS